MFKYIARFSKYVWSNWKTESKNFISSRKELFYLKEFRIAFIIAIIPGLLFPIVDIFSNSNVGGILQFILFILILILALSALAWLAGVGFITIGSILFDNIPTVGDILGIVDMSKGIGVEKSSHIAKGLTFKEEIQEKIGKFFTRIIIKLTISTSSYGVNKFRIAFRKLKRFQIYEFITGFFFAFFVMYIPVIIITLIGYIGVIGYTRPTIGRLPIIVLAVAYLLLISFFPNSMFFFLFMGGYTFFFSEKEDLLKLKPIIGAILYQDERLYNDNLVRLGSKT